VRARLEGVDMVGHSARREQKFLALRGQARIPRAPVEKGHANLRLEIRERVADH
jgi:hypothetical protein